MKNLSRVLSVAAWVTAIVIAWTERRAAQAQPVRSHASPKPESSQSGAEDRDGAETDASSASQAAATPSAAAFDSGPSPALTDIPSGAESTQTPAENVDTAISQVGILAVRDPVRDPQVEEILGPASLQDDEMTGVPPGQESGPSDAASAVASGEGAAAPNDTAGAPRGDRQGPGGTSPASTGGEAAAPVNSVPGTGTAACPDGYPIKGNASSRIYHLPGESSYDRTIPEICFATAEDATAAGFRPRKH